MNATRLLVLGLGAAGLILASCQGVRSAPKGTPRVEIEVVYAIDDPFYEPFRDTADHAAIQRVMRQAIDPLTDVGLRFYPVPTERYASNQKRPDYLMTIRATQLAPNRDLRMTQHKSEDGSETATIEAKLNGVSSTVAVVVEKRRPGGPMLKVGEATGTGGASPTASPTGPSFALDRQSNETNDTAIDEPMLARSLKSAAEKALVKLQEAIDRELSLLSGATQTGGPDSGDMR